MGRGSPWVLDEEQSLLLLQNAYEIEIDTFDTANTYSNGESENILCKMLAK